MSSFTTRFLGIAAIVLGVLVALRMLRILWLVPALALIGGGIVLYRYQKILGRTDRAVYAALWGVGLGVALLVGALVPALFVLAGATILLRGREAQVDALVRTRWQALGLSRRAALLASAVKGDKR
jgi:hypothetical protein